MFLSKLKLSKQVATVVLTILQLFAIPILVVADDEELSEINFYVTPIMSESQVANNSTYFDINTEPGKEQKLGLEITNTSDNAITVEVTAHTAFTNVNGVVEYGIDAEQPDPTLQYSLDEIIEVPESIIVEAKQTKAVDCLLKVPKDSFEGVLAGGIKIQEVKNEVEELSDEEGLAIKNEFNYVIGVILSNERKALEPELELLDVFADQLNHRNVISATIQNYIPTYVNNLSIEAQVKKDGEDEVLYSAERENMQMAPNSYFDFPISLGGERFTSGNYVLSLKAKSDTNEWSWDFPFSIQADEARKLNREDVTVVTGVNWFIVGLLTILFLSFCVIGYLLIKNRRYK